MLHGIAVYDLDENPPKRVDYAQVSSSSGLFSRNDLEKLEKYSLPKYTSATDSDPKYYRVEAVDEHHYFKKIKDVNCVMAICSRKWLERAELNALFANIQDAHMGRSKLHTTLKNIIDNPMGYTRPPIDLKIDRTQQELKELKAIMLKNMDLAIERGENINILMGKTDILLDDSMKFNKEAHKLNKCRLC
ncbi:MAG: R-SNARE family protein [Gammaproteobacteria bacterium]